MQIRRRSVFKDWISLPNKAELQPWRKSKKEKHLRREGTYHPSFVSNRGSIVWHLNSMRNGDAYFPFANANSRQFAFACISDTLTSIVLTTVCWFLIYFLIFCAAGVCQLRFPEVQHTIKVSSIILMGFCILCNSRVLLFTCCAYSTRSRTDLCNWIFYPARRIAGKLFCIRFRKRILAFLPEYQIPLKIIKPGAP